MVVRSISIRTLVTLKVKLLIVILTEQNDNISSKICPFVATVELEKIINIFLLKNLTIIFFFFKMKSTNKSYYYYY